MSYTKLFGSMLDSTVWDLPHATRIVWVTMLAMKDRDGVVEASIPGLARRARVTRTECDAALLQLSSPDPDSRTRDFDGRRVVEVDGGWRVLNHDKYRAKDDADDQREKNAARQQRHRDRKRNVTVTPSNGSNAVSRDVTPLSDMVSYSGSPDPDIVTDPPQLPDGVRDLVQAREASIGSSGATVHATARDPGSGPTPPALDVRRNRALVKRFVDGLHGARTRVAQKFGLKDVRSLSYMHASEPRLIDRLRDSYDPEGDIAHVVAMAEEEAMESGDLRWLSWSLCEPNAWQVRLAGVPGSRAKAKAKASVTEAPKFAAPAPRVELSEAERAELSAMAREAAKIGAKS